MADGSIFMQGFSWGDLIQWGEAGKTQTPRSQTQGPGNEEILNALKQIQNVLVRGFSSQGRQANDDAMQRAATPGGRAGNVPGSEQEGSDPLIDPMRHYGAYVQAARKYEDLLGINAELREKVSQTLEKSAEELSDEQFFSEVESVKNILSEYNISIDEDEGKGSRDILLERIKEAIEGLTGTLSSVMKESFEALQKSADELSDADFSREIDQIKETLSEQNISIDMEEESREDVLQRIKFAVEGLKDNFSNVLEEKRQAFSSFEESLSSANTQEEFDKISFALRAASTEEQRRIAEVTSTPNLIENIRQGDPNMGNRRITDALRDASLAINDKGDVRLSNPLRDRVEPEITRQQVSNMSPEEILRKIEEFGGEGNDEAASGKVLVESFRDALIPVMTQVGDDVRTALEDIQKDMVQSREAERQRLAAASMEEKNALLLDMQERGQLTQVEAQQYATQSPTDVFGPARPTFSDEVLPPMATSMAAYSAGTQAEAEWQSRMQSAQETGTPVDTTGMPLWMQAQLGLQAVGVGGAALGSTGATGALASGAGATGAGVAAAEEAGAGGIAGSIANWKGSPYMAIAGGVAGMASSTLTPGGGMSAQQISQGVTGNFGSLGAAGGMLLGGGLPGAAAGYVLGSGAGTVANQVAKPYFEYVGQQAGYEAITGEDMSTGLSGMPGDVMYGADTIQGQINSARMQNMFTPVEQIETMTDQMLEMGLSTQEASDAIVHLTDTMAELRVSPEFLATIRATGGAAVQASGLDPNVYTREVAAQVSKIAKETGIPQSEVEKTVAQITQSTQAIYGAENANQMGLTTAGIVSAGTAEQQQIATDLGTAGALSAPVDDFSQSIMMGLDPTMERDTDQYQEMLLGSRSSRVDEFFAQRRDEDGSPRTDTMTQSMWETLPMYGPATGLSFEQALNMAQAASDKGTTSAAIAENAGTQSKTVMADTRKKTSEKQMAAARGEDGGTFGRLGADIASIFSGINTGARDPASDLHELAFGVRGDNIKGAAHMQGLAKQSDIDPSKIYVGKGETLGGVLDKGGKEEIENITQGRRRIRFEGEKYTVSEVSALLATGQMEVDKDTGKLTSPGAGAPKHPKIGGIGLPKKGGPDGKDSTVKHEIGLSKEAARLFNIKELSDSSGIPGQVSDQLQRWQKAVNNSPLNSLPILGR